MTKQSITFENIAGISPLHSTYSDVYRLLGIPNQIEQREATDCHGAQVSAKTLLLYPSQGLTIIFGGNGELAPDSSVMAVMADELCSLSTPEGLYLRLPKEEAKAIIEKAYTVRWDIGDDLSLLPLHEVGATVLNIGFDEEKLSYFNLGTL